MRDQKKGKLGPAFHHYLEYLENVEVVMQDEGRVLHVPGVAINQEMFKCTEEDIRSIMGDMFPVDAYLAGVVRSSVKYKINVETLVKIEDLYKAELEYISATTPIRLPHEWCTIIIEGFGDDDDVMILVAQEQTCEQRKTYPELDVKNNEPFICINMMAYRKAGVLDMNNVRLTQRLSHMPVEIHCEHNKVEKQTKVLYAGVKHVELQQEGRRILDLIWNSFLLWHHQFQLQSVLRNKTPGTAPRIGTTIRRHKRRKKHEHPLFEHTVIRMEIDAPDSGQVGYSFLQAKKRLHAVRGFWRSYRKSGLRVWVKPHWRGDEKLGVIRRDIELVTHEEAVDA